MKLKLWPNQKVIYPSLVQGQIYIPFINWLLFVGCLAVVLIFRESSKMEAAYGLAITLNMLMTTSLLTYYLHVKRKPAFMVWTVFIFYMWLEFTFLTANLSKFSHGGWFAVLIAIAIFVVMYLFYLGKKLRNKHIEFVEIKDYMDDLVDLQNMLDFLKYKELTANSNANQQDVDELSKIVNKSMMSKISLRQQIK
jgi:KUP system potassium uptake protein